MGVLTELSILRLKLSENPEAENEIVIGKTNRAISADAENADLKDMEYLIERSGKKVLLYGEEYMVAAAAPYPPVAGAPAPAPAPTTDGEMAPPAPIDNTFEQGAGDDLPF